MKLALLVPGGTIIGAYRTREGYPEQKQEG
jgi:hypothetical protein